MRLPDIAPLSPWPTSPRTAAAWESSTTPSLAQRDSNAGFQCTEVLTTTIPFVPDKYADVIRATATSILPSTSFLLRYPIHVIYTKAAFSEHITQARDKYLLVQSTSTVPAAPVSPGKRWLKEAPRHFYRAKEANVTDDEGRELWKVEPISHLPQRLGYFDITSHIYKRYGWRGFFRGLITSHCMELIHTHLSQQLYRQMEKGYLRHVGRLDENDVRESEQDFKHKFCTWLKTDAGRIALLKLVSNTAASIVTFPLGVLALRQILYEPYDKQPLGFVDMARLTIVFDGPGALTAGLLPYMGIRILLGLTAVVSRGAIAAANWDDGDETLGSFVAEQSKAILESLCHPLIQHIQYKQARSLIPGLVSGDPRSIKQCYKSESPGMFLMLASNIVLLGMRIVASSHFHFLLTGTDED